MRAENGKDKEGAQKARRKPGRVPTSCAECRRLKLRCDKNVPCEKCVSRGCGSICPDGSLTPGKGNRLVLANTEELHDRIEQLCIRVRELENALRTLQDSVSQEPHPLLRTGSLQPQTPSHAPRTEAPSLPPSLPPTRPPTSPQSPPEPVENADLTSTKNDDDGFVDAFGTLTLGRSGDCGFLGKTARAEYLIRALAQPRFRKNNIPSRLSKRAVEPAFPEPEIADHELGREVFSMLPPLSEAIHLCEIYQEYGKYLYTPVPQAELFDEILMLVYRADSFESISCYHSLSLLFIVFAMGCLFDPERQPYSVEAQEYYHIARTALGFSPHTSRISIQALIHLAQYLEFSDWDSMGSNTAWAHIGHAVRLGHSIGLHLNSARWKLSSDNVQRRSRVFWQLFYLDTWASFNFGRPPTISSSFTDCPFPVDSEEVVDADGQKQMSFHSWNWKYTVLLHSVMSTAFGPKPPNYSVILSLDRSVRDFPVPVSWRPSCETPDASVPIHLVMQRWFILSSKESTLLNLHRAHFAQALQERPTDLAKHRYTPSVIAIYRSAWRLIEGLRWTWQNVPRPFSRLNLAWSQALSAAVVMCLLVTRAPTSNMTPSALAELGVLLQLFQDASPNSRSAANLLDSIRTLHQKAHQMMDRTCSQGTSTITPVELDRLGGKTHLLTELGAPGSGDCGGPPDSFTVTGIPQDHYPDINVDTMHPTIVQDMRCFDMGAPTFNNFFDFPTAHHPQPVPDIQVADNNFYPEATFHSYQSAPPPPLTQVQNHTHGHTHMFDQSPPILDSAWQSFAEQLGF
ncbi:fungal-specific transcription factor domain-containing protein [Collybia nuda]|uniref:Fungal-specific transcription factor domain-containing protein n=1 Tax=Collybia nuda TaxID=64659 RepID=A0A9P5Y6A6_9AGAR|nr:fungal-specific transcription factor domain-containing protein [Collybia nuda]